MTSTLRALSGIALVFLSACSGAAQTARAPEKAPAAGDVVARYGTDTVTLAEADERALSQPVSNFGSMRLVDALYEARRVAIDDIINIKLIEREAAAQKVDVRALLDREITNKIVPPTDLDIATWYKANPQRVQGAAIEQVREPIRNLLMQERTQSVRQAYIDSLRSKLAINVSLEAPRVQVEAAGRPTKGPGKAPVEIIEFSDFQCPFCEAAFPTVKQVLAKYGDQVRLTYRHYPLPNHPNARPAAEAAACAAEQNRFWEYHDRLFVNQSKLAENDLKEHAQAVGLDAAAFSSCVASHKYAKQIDEDLEAGNKVGVSGTPAFFVNGRILSGAQPYDVFRRVIEEELARK